jgi:hypothetical protein
MTGKKLRNKLRRSITWAGGWLGPLPTPEKWLFIVGCYNSGTSLIQTLLARHPQIGSLAREGQLCTDQLLLPKSVGLPRLWALEPERFLLNENSRTEINVTRLKRQWGLWMNDVKRPILMEKTPANAARLPWLQANFENAHFLGIIRNGFAVAEGIRRKAGHPLELGAIQWLRSNEIMLDAFETLDNRLLITYEALTEEPAATLSNVLTFLNLPGEGLDGIDGRVWSIHGLESELVNMNGRSLQSLTEAEKAIIENVAGELFFKLAAAA